MSYIGKSPQLGVRTRFYYTATGGETSLSGIDDNGNTLVFTDGTYVDVMLNGITLVAGTDYNTSTANTISGLAALTASDVAEVVVYDVFSVGDTVSKTNGGAFGTKALVIDTVNSRVGVNENAPSYSLEVGGEAVATQGMPYISDSNTARTLALTDSGNYIRFTSGSATTVTIPPNSSVAFPTGTEVILFQAGAGQVTIAAGAGVTLNSKDNNLKLSSQYVAATCKKVATDTWDVLGDLTA